jgi:DNA-binding GntR family transcriptional regulator
MSDPGLTGLRALEQTWNPSGAGRGVGEMGMTVRDRVTRELRHRIIFGRLHAGDRLDLDALAKEFGTSRTPVREACLELANDNLVKVAPRSGVTVIGITEADLLDNFELMTSLAGWAAAWAAERATPEDLVRIEELARGVEQVAAAGGEVAIANAAFHRSINQASHSPRLMALIRQAARLFPDRFSDVVPSQVDCSLQEHADLVGAIADRDPGRARGLMESHFHEASRRLRAHLAGTHAG